MGKPRSLLTLDKPDDRHARLGGEGRELKACHKAAWGAAENAVDDECLCFYGQLRPRCRVRYSKSDRELCA